MKVNVKQNNDKKNEKTATNEIMSITEKRSTVLGHVTRCLRRMNNQLFKVSFAWYESSYIKCACTLSKVLFHSFRLAQKRESYKVTLKSDSCGHKIFAAVLRKEILSQFHLSLEELVVVVLTFTMT